MSSTAHSPGGSGCGWSARARSTPIPCSSRRWGSWFGRRQRTAAGCDRPRPPRRGDRCRRHGAGGGVGGGAERRPAGGARARGAAVEVEGVVCAVPAWATARLLAGLGVSPARDLDDVLYFPSLTVSLAYRREQVAAPLEGTGFVTQLAADVPLRACTYASLKYPARAPAGFLLLRAFLAPVAEDPAAIAHAELAKVLAISGGPLWSRAFHWVRGLPRYRPRHAAHVAAIRERLARLRPIAMAGAGVDRAGVSACVRSGREAAREGVGRLGGET